MENQSKANVLENLLLFLIIGLVTVATFLVTFVPLFLLFGNQNKQDNEESIA